MSGFSKKQFELEMRGYQEPWVTGTGKESDPLKSSTRSWLSVIALETAPILEKAVGPEAFERWLQEANAALVRSSTPTAEETELILEGIKAEVRRRTGES